MRENPGGAVVLRGSVHFLQGPGMKPLLGKGKRNQSSLDNKGLLSKKKTSAKASSDNAPQLERINPSSHKPNKGQ